MVGIVGLVKNIFFIIEVFGYLSFSQLTAL